jgi:hypothetical protein
MVHAFLVLLVTLCMLQLGRVCCTLMRRWMPPDVTCKDPVDALGPELADMDLEQELHELEQRMKAMHIAHGHVMSLSERSRLESQLGQVVRMRIRASSMQEAHDGSALGEWRDEGTRHGRPD